MQIAKTTADNNSLNSNTVKYSWIRLPLLVWLGMMLGVTVAYLISHGNWFIGIGVVIVVPFVVLLSKHPFSGVIIWLLVMPFVSVLPNASLIYWLIYRLIPPFLLFLVILSRILRPREHPPAWLGPPELAMIILVLIIPSSILLFQTNPKLTLILFADRIIMPFCMYLVVRLMAPRAKELVQLQWVALFIALSQIFIGFLSWFAPQVLPEAWQYLQGYYTTGSLKEPDLYAVVLTLCAIILFHAAVNRKSTPIRSLFYAVSGLCAIFIFLSLERAAWLGGIFVIIGLVILYPKVMVRLLIIGSIVMAILGTGILSTHIELSIQRFKEADPVYDRIVIFDAMSQMFQQKPILGWGYETLDQNIGHFYRQVGEGSLTKNVVTSHNTYMTVLTELGLIGLVLYMFPVIWWLILSFKVWPRMPKDGLWSRQLLAGLWLVMLFIFTVSNAIDMRFFQFGLALWWMILGLIANMVYPYLKGRSIEEPSLVKVG